MSDNNVTADHAEPTRRAPRRAGKRSAWGVAAVMVLCLGFGFVGTGLVRSSGMLEALRRLQLPTIAARKNGTTARYKSATAQARSKSFADSKTIASENAGSRNKTALTDSEVRQARKDGQIAALANDTNTANSRSTTSQADGDPGLPTSGDRGEQRAPQVPVQTRVDGHGAAVVTHQAMDWEEEHNELVDRQMQIVDDLMGGDKRRRTRR